MGSGNSMEMVVKKVLCARSSHAPMVGTAFPTENQVVDFQRLAGLYILGLCSSTMIYACGLILLMRSFC